MPDRGRWSFAGAGDANQDDVGLIVVASPGAVIVIQGEMHRVDADSVGLCVTDGVALVDLVVEAHTQFIFEGPQEGAEQVENQGIAAMQDGAVIDIHQGGEHDGLGAVFLRGFVDTGHCFPGLLIGLDKGQGDLNKFDTPELAEHAVAQGFCGNAGAVG